MATAIMSVGKAINTWLIPVTTRSNHPPIHAVIIPRIKPIPPSRIKMGSARPRDALAPTTGGIIRTGQADRSREDSPHSAVDISAVDLPCRENLGAKKRCKDCNSADQHNQGKPNDRLRIFPYFTQHRFHSFLHGHSTWFNISPNSSG